MNFFVDWGALGGGKYSGLRIKASLHICRVKQRFFMGLCLLLLPASSILSFPGSSEFKTFAHSPNTLILFPVIPLARLLIKNTQKEICTFFNNARLLERDKISKKTYLGLYSIGKQIANLRCKQKKSFCVVGEYAKQRNQHDKSAWTKQIEILHFEPRLV